MADQSGQAGKTAELAKTGGTGISGGSANCESQQRDRRSEAGSPQSRTTVPRVQIGLRRRAQGEAIRLVCQELIIHTGLEDEIFYPAYRDAGCEDDVMDEAQVEHDSAKMLIADLLDADPEEQFTDAKVAVLAEKIKHHAEEEEPAQGIIAQAQAKAHGRQRGPRPPPDGTTAGTRCRPSAHARRFLQRSGEHDAERSR